MLCLYNFGSILPMYLGNWPALLVVHTKRAGSIRIISFRYASEEESGAYYEWLENAFENKRDDTR